MNWSYALALVISTIAAVSISIVAWRRRAAQGANALMLLAMGIAVWTVTYSIHFMAAAPAERFFWLKATYLGVVAVPTFFLVFALQYAGQGHWVTGSRAVLLAVEPLLTLVIVWTDPWHGFFFGGEQPVGMIMKGGAWFWVNVIYSYILILIGFIWLIHAFRHTARPLRGQAGAVLAGSALPAAANILGLLQLNPFPDLDVTPFAFTATSICLAIGLARYRLLDIVPIARDAIVESLSDGVMVLDPQARILDINRSALEMLGWDGQQVIGLLAGQAFPEFRRLFSRFSETVETRQEILLDGDPPRSLDLRISPLYDHHGRYSGRLVVAHDITQRRLAEQSEHELRVLAEALRDTAAALISSRSFDEVLDHLLDNVGRVVPHELATFMLLDEHDIAHVARSRGYREHGLQAYEKLMRLSVGDIPNFLKMIETGRALVVPDTRQSEDWIVVSGLESLRSYVGAPVQVKGRVVGFLDLTSLQPGFFNQGHADRLQAFADLAAIAIENARLFDETRQRAEQMTALFDIGVMVTSGLDMDHVLTALLEKCKQVLPVEAFYVAILDPETGLIDHPLFYDLGESHVLPPRDIAKKPGLSGYVIKTRQTLYLPDALDPDTARKYDYIRAGGKPTRSYVGVPMVVGNQAVGVISMQSYQPHAFTSDQIRLLETIATQAAGVIENSRLYEKVRRELTQRQQAERSLRKANKRLQAQLAEIEALQEKLREQVTRDPLTGLFNRRHLEEALENEFQRAGRAGGSVCLIMMDIDGFKGFNDVYGHDAGDFLLRNLGELLRKEIRRSDMACRYGGEEFLIMMPGAALERGYERAENLRTSFESLDIEHMGVKLRTTLSLGVAVYPQHGPDWKMVLHAADRAMYAAKGAGKNCTRTA